MIKRIRNIEICKLLNGYELSLVLHEYTNNKPGPTLGLSATIHGDEDLPIEILRLFALELKKLDFKGKVLMLPVANPMALGVFSRKNPIDMVDINRVFPGSEKGTLSQKIARTILTEYIPHADYFIDLHSGGAIPTVEYSVIYPNSIELGRMMGQKYLNMGTSIPGMMAYYLAEQNKPVVIGEFGGGGQNNKYYIEQGIEGIKNVMKYLKMIDGEPKIPSDQYLLKNIFVVSSNHGGILVPNIGIDYMHSILSKNDLLGTTYSPYNFEKLETFYGPFDNNLIILMRADISRVETGDMMYIIGNKDTVEKL